MPTASQNIPAGTFRDGFAITRSDTVDVVDDAANTKDYKSVQVHNAGASGTVRVLTVEGADLTLYCVQGDTLPVAVKRVFTTGTATTLIGLVAKD